MADGLETQAQIVGRPAFSFSEHQIIQTEDVLGQAASRQGRYKIISVAEQQQARQMLREFRRAPENVSGNLIGVDLQGEVLRVSPWARN